MDAHMHMHTHSRTAGGYKWVESHLGVDWPVLIPFSEESDGASRRRRSDDGMKVVINNWREDEEKEAVDMWDNNGLSYPCSPACSCPCDAVCGWHATKVASITLKTDTAVAQKHNSWLCLYYTGMALRKVGGWENVLHFQSFQEWQVVFYEVKKNEPHATMSLLKSCSGRPFQTL